MSALRLFFAVPAPEALRERAAQVQERLRGHRAALPSLDGLHLTLAFLGAQDPAQVPGLLEAAARTAARHAPFDLRTAGLGGFPSLSAPRVLYLAFEPEPALDALAADLRGALKALGASFDPKPLRPHLTLARPKAPADLRDLGFPGGPTVFPVREVVLYESTLTGSGSIYRSLGAPPLVG